MIGSLRAVMNRNGGCFMNWEPWTGCYKVSDGCSNCYFYGPNAKRYGQNTIQKTDKFDWPVRTNAKGEYNIKGNKILATCFATDFFLTLVMIIFSAPE